MSRSRRTRSWTAFAAALVTALSGTVVLLAAGPAGAYDGTYTFSVSDAQVVEGDPGDDRYLQFFISVQGTAGPVGDFVRIDYSTYGGTATETLPAVPGGDFEHRAGTAFPTSALPAVVNIPIVEDDLAEGDEQMEIRLVGAANLIADGTGVGTITDDDPAQKTLTVEVTGASRPSTSGLGLFDVGRGVVSSQPAGVACGTAPGAGAGDPSDCTGDYAADQQVVLTATPGSVLLRSTDPSPTEMSTFTGWGGACAGVSGSTCTVTMSQARTVTAAFGLDLIGNVSVRIDAEEGPASGLDLSRRASGRITSSPAPIDCRTNDNLTGTRFSGVCSADFSRGNPVVLTQTPQPIRVRSALGTWSSSSQLSSFGGWTGDCITSTATTCTVLVEDVNRVTARFDLVARNTLEVKVRAEGIPSSPGNLGSPFDDGRNAGGTVTTSPAGISCSARAENGVTRETTCSSRFVAGSMVTLTATPLQLTNGSGQGAPFIEPQPSTFIGWTGACALQSTAPTCTVTMDQARSVTATFDVGGPFRDLTVVVGEELRTDPPGIGRASRGVVTALPAGINCFRTTQLVSQADCTQTYGDDQVVTLTATPRPVANLALEPYGYVDGSGEMSTFDGWGGACAARGTQPTCTVTMNQALTVTAQFGLQQYYDLSVTLNLEQVPAPFGGVARRATGSVTSLPVGINCYPVNGIFGSPACSMRRVENTVVTLTATSAPVQEQYFGIWTDTNETSLFTGWGGACAFRGTQPTCTVTLSQARSVTAGFGIPKYSDVTVFAFGQTKNHAPTLSGRTADVGVGTVTSSPAGITCRSDGSLADCSERYPTSSATVTLTAVTGLVRREEYDTLGQLVQVVNLPITSTFGGWTGACTGTALTCTVSLAQSRSVTAIFNVPTIAELTVSIVGVQEQSGFDQMAGPIYDAPGGRVTSSPAAIDCHNSAGTCEKMYVPSNATITLTATPEPVGWFYVLNPSINGTRSYDSVFTGWSGACTGTAPTCTVTLSQSRNVTANFGLPRRVLTVSVSEQVNSAGTQRASGRIVSNPTGISCIQKDASDPTTASSDCSEAYTINKVVTLTAVPALVRVKSGLLGTWSAGSTLSRFGGWTGACAYRGTAPTCTVTMSEALSVGASFRLPGA